MVTPYSYLLYPVLGLAQASKPPSKAGVFFCLWICSAYCHLSKNLCALKGGEMDLKILTAINRPASPRQSIENWHGCFKAKNAFRVQQCPYLG
jgi:hypothetical protein